MCLNMSVYKLNVSECVCVQAESVCVFYTTFTPEPVQAESAHGQSLWRCGVFRGQSQGRCGVFRGQSVGRYGVFRGRSLGRCGVFPRHRGQARDGHVGGKTGASLPRGPSKQQAIKQILSLRGAPANGV